MGHALERAAKALARRRVPMAGDGAAARPPRLHSAERPIDSTRREFLKRIGVVGATAWTVPILQTAVAPAASASVAACLGVCGTLSCPPCGPGQGPCTTAAECAAGTVCTNGLCVIPFGAPGACTSNLQCQSNNCSGSSGSAGVCLRAWPDSPCTTNAQCQSGRCVGGRCFANGLGGSCRTTVDCTDNTACSASSQTCGGQGAPCTNNNKCTSGRCAGGICS